MKKYQIPEKPEKLEDQVEMLWFSNYNHIPAWFELLNEKIDWNLRLTGVLLALVAVVVPIVIVLLT